jgi:cell division protein FtsQ
MKMDEENLKGARISKVNLKEIEKRVRKDKFVRNAELYSDLKGNMIARVELQRPIARIIRKDGPDGYIAEDGTLMPTSDKYTTRVLLLSGSYMKKFLKQESLHETEEGRLLMNLINVIRSNDFWKAQIAQLDMDSRARIVIYPQIGGQIIEFGKLENIDIKMNKLRIFYKDILPQMGWNKYDRVNLEYEGQIVAE